MRTVLPPLRTRKQLKGNSTFPSWSNQRLCGSHCSGVVPWKYIVPGARAVPSETTTTSRSPILKLFAMPDLSFWLGVCGAFYMVTATS